MPDPLPSQPALTRRDAVRLIGLGTAAAATGAARLAAADGPAPAPDAWALPALPYAYGALEPHLDARTMEIHHSRHHQAYVTAARKAAEPYPELMRKSPEQVITTLSTLPLPEAVRLTLRNQLGGHVNHALFWRILAPGGRTVPEGFLQAVNGTFGSMDELRRQLADAAARRFGSGWAWLSLREGRMFVHSTANQDSPLMEGATPLLGIDVWEHAYYLRYQNLRADYVKACFEVVNWSEVARNHAAALGRA